MLPVVTILLLSPLDIYKQLVDQLNMRACSRMKPQDRNTGNIEEENIHIVAKQKISLTNNGH